MSHEHAVISSEKNSMDHHHIEHLREGTIASSSESGTHYTGDELSVVRYPNRWAHIRSYLREPAAEFLGTMILIIFGTGVDCQVVLSGSTAVASSPKGDYLSISFGWAIGTALGVWFAGGITGGHINPAVTLSLAVFRGFPWKKVPVYMLAQLLGALTGSTIVYWNYINAINLFEGGPNTRTLSTASLFSTYAADYMTNASCFWSEFIATAVLLLVVMAITDKKNGPPPAGLNPLVLFILILGEGACLGMETAYAINPARDLGPRLMTAMVGYGTQVFSYRNQYWLWCPIIAPFCGALFGVFIYDAFIFEGEESILNKPDARARARNIHAPHEERQKPIAAADNV